MSKSGLVSRWATDNTLVEQAIKQDTKKVADVSGKQTHETVTSSPIKSIKTVKRTESPGTVNTEPLMSKWATPLTPSSEETSPSNLPTSSRHNHNPRTHTAQNIPGKSHHRYAKSKTRTPQSIRGGYHVDDQNEERRSHDVILSGLDGSPDFQKNNSEASEGDFNELSERISKNDLFLSKSSNKSYQKRIQEPATLGMTSSLKVLQQADATGDEEDYEEEKEEEEEEELPAMTPAAKAFARRLGMKVDDKRVQSTLQPPPKISREQEREAYRQSRISNKVNREWDNNSSTYHHRPRPASSDDRMFSKNGKKHHQGSLPQRPKTNLSSGLHSNKHKKNVHVEPGVPPSTSEDPKVAKETEEMRQKELDELIKKFTESNMNWADFE